MDINEIRQSGLIEYYVLGLLSEQDAQMVEGYLMQYPELQADYLEIQNTMQAYTKVQGIKPSEGLERNALELIRKSGKKTPVQIKSEKNKTNEDSTLDKTSSSSLDWKSLALPALLAAALFFSWDGYNKGLEYDTLQEEYNSYKEDCESQQEEEARRRTIYANINSVNNKTIELTPTADYQETNLLFHNNDVAETNYIQVKNLPEIASNQAFQLWSLKDGVDPIPLTVFKDGDDLVIPVDFEAGTGTYAITIEDEAGATVPTLTRLIGTIGV